MERVPCKLNNERNEKHQTGAQKCATEAWGGRVKSITCRTKDKKFEAMTNSSVNDLSSGSCLDTMYREFDPGSGRTLAACLTHASRTRICGKRIRPIEIEDSGGRVSNA